MRIALLATLLFSVATRCRGDGAGGLPADCIEDCSTPLTGRGLAADGMANVCTTSQLELVHFQCLMDLAHKLAMSLTCSTGGDGLMTVSFGLLEPTATASLLNKEDGTEFPILSSTTFLDTASQPTDKAMLMQSPGSGLTSSCERSSSRTSMTITSSWSTSTLTSFVAGQLVSETTSECSGEMLMSVGTSTTSTTSTRHSSTSTEMRSSSKSTISAPTSNTACPSALNISNEISVHAVTPTSSSISLSSTSLCTEFSSSFSRSLTTTSTRPCPSITQESTSTNRTSSSFSSVSPTSSCSLTSSTFTAAGLTAAASSASSTVTNSEPAAYTFMTSSLPPSYVAPLEDYGYGSLPQAYGSSSRSSREGNANAHSITPTSSPTMATSTIKSMYSNGQSRATGSPASYDTASASLAPAGGATTSPTAPGTSEAFRNNPDMAMVTVISSIEGGVQTTVMTINNAGVAPTGNPFQLALNDASNSEESENGLSMTHRVAAVVASSSADSEADLSVRTQSPMPAMLVAGGMSDRPCAFTMSMICLVLAILY